MSKITLRLLSMTLLLAIGAISAWAEDHDFTVRPSLEKHIRFSGNATDGYSFVKGYPKDYTTVTGTYEMKYTAGLVVLQQYDFSDVDWSKVTKLTIQTTTSTDKNGYAAYWIYDGDAAEAITADVFGPKAVEAIGIDPGNTTGPANADAVTNYVSRTKVDDSHFTEIAEITGEKLATLKTKLHSGKLSLIVTRQGATSNNQKWMYSSNEANGDYRPVIYLDYGAVVNASKGTAYASLNDAFGDLQTGESFLPDPNENLILIQGYQFANAAELLSDYTDWKAADKESFKTWIHHTFGDNALIYLSGRQDQHYWLNWDLAALSSLMSVGVLCNDKAMVDYALNYIDNGAGTGSVNHAIVALHNDGTLAQCQEVGRDQGHATLDVTLMGALCQTAKNANVGVDLFEKYHALEMAEYIGMYNLKDANGSFVNNDVPFTAYTVDDNEYTAISDASRGTERNCWELFHAYAKANNKTAKNVEAWVKYLRDKNAYGEGASTSNDELGFGTLMYGAATTATGIKGVTTDKIGVSSPAIYNLAGQRVGKDYKGLVIINGKKVVKK